MMDHAKTLKWYFVMLRIHVLAWLWQECVTQCIMAGWLWEECIIVVYGKI